MGNLVLPRGDDLGEFPSSAPPVALVEIVEDVSPAMVTQQVEPLVVRDAPASMPVEPDGCTDLLMAPHQIPYHIQ